MLFMLYRGRPERTRSAHYPAKSEIPAGCPGRECRRHCRHGCRLHRSHLFRLRKDSALVKRNILRHQQHRPVITDLSVALTYKDMSGRILDRRLVNVAVEIPAGETRRIDINSWDRQKAFYYHLSAVPRSSQATPYRINVRLLAALAKH